MRYLIKLFFALSLLISSESFLYAEDYEVTKMSSTAKIFSSEDFIFESYSVFGDENRMIWCRFDPNSWTDKEYHFILSEEGKEDEIIKTFSIEPNKNYPHHAILVNDDIYFIYEGVKDLGGGSESRFMAVGKVNLYTKHEEELFSKLTPYSTDDIHSLTTDGKNVFWFHSRETTYTYIDENGIERNKPYNGIDIYTYNGTGVERIENSDTDKQIHYPLYQNNGNSFIYHKTKNNIDFIFDNSITRSRVLLNRIPTSSTTPILPQYDYTIGFHHGDKLAIFISGQGTPPVFDTVHLYDVSTLQPTLIGTTDLSDNISQISPWYCRFNGKYLIIKQFNNKIIVVNLEDGTKADITPEDQNYYSFGDMAINEENAFFTGDYFDSESGKWVAKIIKYNFEDGITTPIAKTDGPYTSNSLCLHGDKIIWSTNTGGSYNQPVISIAKPITFKVTNVGDGESIRLTWEDHFNENEELKYRIKRKDEKLIDQEINWVLVNEDFDIQPNLDGLYTYCDNRKTPYLEQDEYGYKGPKRGVVYDYKIEVLSQTNQIIRVIGPKKGVSEPFIMLVRGYGKDDLNYWNPFIEDLEDNRGFTGTSQTIEKVVNGQTLDVPIPKNIWDTSALEHLHIYPFPGTDPSGYRIGQIHAQTTGEALFQELTGYKYSLKNNSFEKVEGNSWLDELKTSTQRYSKDGAPIDGPDYRPEHFYAYSHSMGSPNSRWLGTVIDEYRDQYSSIKNFSGPPIPYIKKNVLLSPANCGSILAWKLQSSSNVADLIFSEWISDKKQWWPSSHFLTPDTVAKYNFRVKPSIYTKYYFLGGHDWEGGGYGSFIPNPVVPLKNRLRFGPAFIWLLIGEADNYFDRAMWNDNSLTVTMQRGIITNKVWKILEDKYGFQGRTKKDYEFRPIDGIEDHFTIQPTLPLNHYYGVIGNEVMHKLSWEQLDIYPRFHKVHIEDDGITSPFHPPTSTFPVGFPEIPFEVPFYHSHSSEDVLAGASINLEFQINSREEHWLGVSWEQLTEDFSCTLTNPTGQIITPESLPLGVKLVKDNTGAIYYLETPETGTWTATIHNDTAKNDSVILQKFSRSDYTLSIDIFKSVFNLAEPIQVLAALKNGDNFITEKPILTQIINDSNSSIISEINLVDDGISDDGIPNNGIYGNQISPLNIEGNYKIVCSTSFDSDAGHPINLMSEELVSIVNNNRITPEIYGTPLPIGTFPYTGLSFDMTVSLNYHNPYIVSAQLTDQLGNFVANGIGHIYGESGETVQTQILFKGEDIYNSGLNGPYVISSITAFKDDEPFITTFDHTATSDQLNFTDFSFQDKDNDGLSDFAEIKMKTSFEQKDSDNDGMSDYEEVNYDGNQFDLVPGADTNPLDPDTDGDSHIDGLDVFPLDPNEWSDRDGDGYGDNSDYDPDDPNVWENPNEAPTAVISGTTTYELSSIDGATISLDGTQSSDPDEGDMIESFTWTGTFGSIQSETLNVTLPIGSHNISLVVNDGELDSEPANITVIVQDTIAPSVTINSPIAKAYGVSEDNPIVSYEVTDLGGVIGEIVTLNGTPISQGETINLLNLLETRESTLRVEAIDPSSNQAIHEVNFSVFNSTNEIRKIVDKALAENKIRRFLARWINLHLNIYDYFINTAKFYENRGCWFWAKICRRIAKRTLRRVERKVQRMKRWIDPNIKSTLTICLRNLKA